MSHTAFEINNTVASCRSPVFKYEFCCLLVCGLGFLFSFTLLKRKWVNVSIIYVIKKKGQHTYLYTVMENSVNYKQFFV